MTCIFGNFDALEMLGVFMVTQENSPKIKAPKFLYLQLLMKIRQKMSQDFK